MNAIKTAIRRFRFEGTCSRCNTRCTNSGKSGNWRHDKRQADGHRAHPTGTLRQI